MNYILLILSVIVMIVWIILIIRYTISMASIPNLKNYDENARVLAAAIIPVRNDDPQRCIESLVAENCIKEIIVVDDDSGPEFKSLLLKLKEKYPVIKIVESRGKGKATACQQGADASNSELLLFLDADTILSNKTAARSINLLVDKGLDAVSLIGELRCRNFDKIMTPFSFGLLNALIPLKDVMNPAKSGFFFGSFILFRTSSYYKIGGHSAVSDRLLEDKALGEVAKKKGLKIAIAKGRGFVSAEWAPGFKQNLDALKRVLAPSMVGKRKVSLLVTIAISFLLLTPLLSFFAGFGNRYLLVVGIISLFFQLLFSIISSVTIKVNYLYAIAFPAAAIMLTLIFWISLLTSYKHGNIVWRGREYRLM